ncbi:hypothetical protein MCOR25_010339 [Pyricularia grisea]|nr:hypothetical protein MCOR25_010339 [Pyricularia grisea]
MARATNGRRSRHSKATNGTSACKCAKSRKVAGKRSKKVVDEDSSSESEEEEEDSASDCTTEDETEDEEADDKSSDEDTEEEADRNKSKSKKSKKPKKPKKKLAPRGSLATPKNIYRSLKDSDGNWTWVDKYPKDVPEPAENDETAQYAVLVRNVKSNDARKKLEAHSIVIQSPHLKKALGEILTDYPGVAIELDRLEFEAPFVPFVHRWEKFKTYVAKAAKDADADDKDKDKKDMSQHLTVLDGILRYEIGDKIAAFEDYIRHGVIKFSDLWMIFQPGDVAVTSAQTLAMELVETEYMENQCGKFLRVRGECVDFSGTEFGRSDVATDIPEFLGTKPITGLNINPLSFHADRDALRTALISRGARFEELAGHKYRQYNGAAIGWDHQGKEVPVEVTGRVVVDIESFNRFSPWTAPRRYVDDWNARDLERLEAHKLEHGLNEDGSIKLTPFHQMICHRRTRGYSLKAKKWLDFYVDRISEIRWDDDAFDKLVLDQDHKELIMAFTESQLDAESKGSFDDVIAGKGQGVICLLSGPPGVGKTLTAEAVAEHLRVPLHTLSSGDLGSRPHEVEAGLSRILELVARWNAVLLLDECDVFLEARSTHDLERNKVVSIFLRTLEYFQGIMFMTTNRCDNIDRAFQSRIHVSLEYPDLTPASRAAVWRNFLGGRMSVPERDIDDLAEIELNGRQIKNVLKTAQLLANRKGSALKSEFIHTVLAIEKKRPGQNKPIS